MMAKAHNPHHHPYRGAVHRSRKRLHTPVRQGPNHLLGLVGRHRPRPSSIPPSIPGLAQTSLR